MTTKLEELAREISEDCEASTSCIASQIETALKPLLDSLSDCIQSMGVCTSATFGCLPNAREQLSQWRKK